MQISCPGCKSRIQVPDDKIKPQGTKVKCGKCAKIFTVKRAARPAEPAPVAPKNTESDLFSGDNFGAEMDNYRTQLRPMGGDRDEDMFGSSGDLDSPSQASHAASTRTDTDDLFGSAEDLDQASPEAQPQPESSASSDDLLDRLAADIRATKDEIAAEEPPARAADSESLDKIFGKGLDSDNVDDLFGSPQGPSDFDDLISQPEPPGPASGPSALDALFSDEPEVAPRKPAARKPEPRPAPSPTPAPAPAPAPVHSGPPPEKVAAEMTLEPALKEEDVPRVAPPQGGAAAQQGHKQARPRKRVTRRLLLLVTLLLTVAGSAAAYFYVPSVRQLVETNFQKLPIDKFLALIGEAPEIAEPMLITAERWEGRTLQGPNGDTMYIIEGNLVNGYSGSRSFIKIRGDLINENGEVIATREVFAGNALNDDELRGLPRVRIDGILNRSVGDGLSNFNLAAGSRIPFQIVFYDITEPVKDTLVVPVSSEPGS